MKIETFGHGVFMQAADNTVIRNSEIEGLVRSGADMYDDGVGSLPDQSEYKILHGKGEGEMIDPEKMYPLAEDGIRTYSNGIKKNGEEVNTGRVEVYDTKVFRMRNCVSFTLLTDTAYLENVELQGCEAGFSMPQGGGDLVNSRADAAYGPAIQTQYGSSSNSLYEVEILDAPFNSGSHNLIEINGSNHEIRLTSDSIYPRNVRPIVIGFGLGDWDDDSSDIELLNDSNYPVELTEGSSGTTGYTFGDLDDQGSANDVLER